MKDLDKYRTIISQLILLFADIILLYLALSISLWIRYQNNFDIVILLDHIRPFTVIYILWIGIFYTNNLYNLTKIRQGLNFYLDLTRSLFIGGVIAVIMFYLLPDNDLTPKRLLLMNIVAFAVLATIWRSIFIHYIGKYIPTNKIAIVGITVRSLSLGRQLLTSKTPGYQLVALSGDGNQDISIPPGIKNNIKIINQPKDLLSLIKNQTINTIIFANGIIANNLMHKFFKYFSIPIKFYNLPDFYEELNYKIPVTELNHGWFLNNINETDKNSFDIIKRILDIVFALILIIIFIPIIFICAMAIVIESVGKIFYIQQRIGKNNKKFMVYKLRTMIKNAEKDGPQWSQKEDPRVTKIGRFLRKSRLDEMPQLINILKGDMSFIGPRPERPEMIDPLINEVPFYQTRHLIKPGLTGWAQVNFPYGSSIKDALEKLQYDLYYIKHRSLSLDLNIIIRTILTVLGLKGR